MVTEQIDSIHQALIDTAKQYHPKLAELFRRSGPIDLSSSHDGSLIEFLARAVVSQQLSSFAASSIWSRISELRAKKKLDFQQLFAESHQLELRNCGISSAKVKAITQMNAAISSGELSEKSIASASYDDIGKQITKLWGYGSWSADMVAMFFVKLPDIWPETDVALIRGMRSLVPYEEPSLAANQYSPFRTYLARQIWRGLDNGFI